MVREAVKVPPARPIGAVGDLVGYFTFFFQRVTSGLFQQHVHFFFSTRHFWLMSATPKCTFNFYAGSRSDGTRCCERADESSGGGNDIFLLQGATLRRARKGVRRGDPMVEFHRDVSPADMDSPGPTPSERPPRPQSSAKRASSLLSVPWRFFSERSAARARRREEETRRAEIRREQRRAERERLRERRFRKYFQTLW